MTGTLTLHDDGHDSSPVGTIRSANCSGLADDGFNVVYDYDNSNHYRRQGRPDDHVRAARGHDVRRPRLRCRRRRRRPASLVTFAATGNCTLIAGVTVHITGGRHCTITASQAGDARYNAAADVTRTFTIKKANADDLVHRARRRRPSGTPTSRSIATASSGPARAVVGHLRSVHVSSATAPATCTSRGAGACTITASQPGDSNYNAGA